MSSDRFGRARLLRGPAGLVSLCLRLIGVLGLLVILFFAVDISEVGDAIGHADIGLLVLGTAVLQVAVFLRARRWSVLAHGSGARYGRFTDYLAVFYTGWFATAVAFQGVGPFAQAWFMYRDGQPVPGSVAGILLDRLFDVAAILVAGLFGLMLLASTLSAAVVGGLVVPVAAALVMVVGLLAALPRLARPVDASVAAPRIGALRRALFPYARDALQALRGLGRRGLAEVAVLSALVVVAHGLSMYILSLALSLDLGFDFVLAAWTFVGLGMLLPISILGLGTREATLIGLFASIGETREAATTLGLAMFFAALAVRLPGAVFWIWRPTPKVVRAETTVVEGQPENV